MPMSKIDFYNVDCMEAMPQYPDGYFDLAIVDPPYGIGCMTMTYTKEGSERKYGYSLAKRRDYKKQADWDIKPDKEYFDELFRVAKRKIIWGGNYFADMLPPSKSFIVWDKRCNDAMRNSFADCEYAWADHGVARMFRFVWNGMIQGDMKNKEERLHPTQKPVALYEWILNNYAKPGYKILDTHVGSGSSLVACHNLGFDCVGFELDSEYFELASNRLEQVKAQTSIFEFV